MSHRASQWVVKHWIGVILCWLTLLAAGWVGAPSWDSITRDGDFSYLPADRPSVIGQRLLEQAFPDSQSKSQLVVFVARQHGTPRPLDLYAAYDLAQRLHNVYGVALLSRAQQQPSAPSTGAPVDAATESAPSPSAAALAKQAIESFDQSIEFGQKLAEYLEQDESAPLKQKRLEQLSEQFAATLRNRAAANHLLDLPTVAEQDLQTAAELDAKPVDANPGLIPQAAVSVPITDLWTWRTETWGSKLLHLKDREAYARLMIVHLSSEFMAVQNIQLFELIQQQIDEVRAWVDADSDAPIELGVSGSAAVGSDLLLASKASIAHTEWYAIILVVLILVLVYRSPILILVPMITIVVSLSVAISLLSLLTQFGHLPGFSWWDFKVFKTTKIFIVVILYGAGTDYCLFLISRYREEVARGMSSDEAIATALSQVGRALTASALTTIIGLSTLFFAEFGKLRNSGPAIGVCLAVTLLACLTLTPAILRPFGKWIFWPQQPHATRLTRRRRKTAGLWHRAARLIVTYPVIILVICCGLMAPAAWTGIRSMGHVTYDLLSGLNADRPSRQGTEILRTHFPVGESGPVVVLIKKSTGGFLDAQGEIDPEKRQQIQDLAETLQQVDGVESIRSLATPLGNESLRGGVVPHVVESLPIVRAVFVTQVPELNYGVTRMEAVLNADPFSIEANRILQRISDRLAEIQQQEGSFWSDASFSFAGTTAAIADLRSVTKADNLRVQVLAVLAVYLVLVVLLRRPGICLYMIATVLFSFFVALGVTHAVFSYAYGDSFQGLEWKVPLFLYVILVAIGEDYNVYLATRIFEEQTRWGPIGGLRRAIVRTGGIITSCGLIMAGTFVSMTSSAWGDWLSAWLPGAGAWLVSSEGSLQGIVQLGFALALGVLLDTFVVRTILLPAFIAILCHRQQNAIRVQRNKRRRIS